ncbi:hypothetical protein ILYODFUR_010386 [Ilyodon furcidens]|uniref:Uncharacterized protein n=1 Tax=Ilyodon furcidens TaxID=33524 RepID=A0ABV0VEF7_9TELE
MAQKRRALIGETETAGSAHRPFITFSTSPCLSSSSSPPTNEDSGRSSANAGSRSQTYGKNSLFSFFQRWVHYSLKIPPKKRRRFSKTFRPLSHGSPVSVQVYERYPEGLGAALYREHFDFNAEPPWDPS